MEKIMEYLYDKKFGKNNSKSKIVRNTLRIVEFSFQDAIET